MHTPVKGRGMVGSWYGGVVGIACLWVYGSMGRTFYPFGFGLKTCKKQRKAKQRNAKTWLIKYLPTVQYTRISLLRQRLAEDFLTSACWQPRTG